ncbi:hypothetical protein [Novosphingopyxis baekryungensis]|jgi:hypothetical protein|uniref:hypothetical protein n=1 Tax=Novosphingopyxis baekryungensis TaxID=279369 RepID=UPI0003B468B4|nr:hypothetical protein [Novosphingopyxis baekryungensis]
MKIHNKQLMPTLALAFALAACSSAENEAEELAETADKAVAQAETGEMFADAGDFSASDDTSADRDIDMLASRSGQSNSGGSTGARDLARIPAAFRGTWAITAGDCAARNHSRFTVAGTGVYFFEGGGKAREIRRNGSALALTYLETNESLGPEPKAVYFASLDEGGAMRVKMGDGQSVRYTRCTNTSVGSSDDNRAETGAIRTVPVRFQGLYALDERACAEDYNYAPAFQNVTVQSDRVSFFETGGPVTDVNVNGDNVAITLRERVGDSVSTRAIFLRLNGDGTARYRAGSDEPVESYVRCGG